MSAMDGYNGMHPAFSMLHVAFFTPRPQGMGLGAVFEGTPGPGKTSVIQQFGRLWKTPTHILATGSAGPAQYGVVAVPIGSGADMRLFSPPPSVVDSMQERGLFVADELVDCSEQTAPGVQALFGERRLGDYYFKPTTRIMGLFNPPKISTRGRDFTIPQANRLCFLQWPKVNLKTWLRHEAQLWQEDAMGDSSWAWERTQEERDPDAEERRVRGLMPKVYANVLRDAGAFHHSQNVELGVLDSMPDSKSPEARRAWPSPRSWEHALHALAGCVIHGASEELTSEFVCGCIGKLGDTFLTYRANSDFPDADSVLDGNVHAANGGFEVRGVSIKGKPEQTWKYDPERVDILFGVLFACNELIRRPEVSANTARVNNYIKLLNAVPHKELLCDAYVSLAKARLYAHPGVVKLRQDIWPLLVESGLVGK